MLIKENLLVLIHFPFRSFFFGLKARMERKYERNKGKWMTVFVSVWMLSSALGGQF